jgi:beta-1,4-mannosyl-glycoprotein beta-1,4-N-acetylglucosaminyltransferase
MIVDCFPFYEELELLEIRLAELSGVVDWFVLVEAGQTYTGKAKEFVFEAHRERFAGYPILAVKIGRYPEELTSAWDREVWNRNALAAGLASFDLAPSDVVLLSDADEIPKAETVSQYAPALAAHPVHGCCVFSQALSYYYLNCRAADPWQGTRMTRFGDLTSFAALRASPGIVLPDAGWHFSYLGGVERIRRKVGAFSHTELDTPEHTDPDHVARCMAQACDLFGRPIGLRFTPLDRSYPKYLFENQERFRDLIYTNIQTNSSLPLPSDPGVAVYSEAAVPAPAPENTLGAAALFERALGTAGDIREHLDFLYRLASTVEHITELGTRRGASASAFLLARPRRLVCYDLDRSEAVSELEAAAEKENVRFEFRQEDVLGVEIEPTDLLFIDTWHVEGQMRAELERHANRSRRYLVLHDTETFGQQGETPGHGGIWGPVAEFARANPHWRLLQHFPHNNGLTVFART